LDGRSSDGLDGRGSVPGRSKTFSLLSYFEKNRLGLLDHVALCVCDRVSPIVARQWLGKNTPIVVRKRFGKNTPIVARQRLGRNVTAVTNTHVTIEELLVASFSMWPVSYQGK
jgi:hypothetical protein